MDVGATLRQAREQKGLTLDRLSRVTRVTLPILAAIERNDPSGIPPRPYGRGFVRSYASEVGLDPDQAVRDFFSQFAPPPAPAPEPPQPSRTLSIPRVAVPRWATFSLVGLGLGLMVILAFTISQSRRAPTDVAQAVGTSGRSAPSTPSTMGPAEPTAPVDGITITLEATGPSWVRADVDGQRAIYRTLLAGDREVLRARQKISIRTGDAGALRWQVGRRAATTMGHPGEVLSTIVTAADTRR